MLPPDAAWRRLVRLQDVLAEQPALRHALGRLPLFDQLSMTLELLHAPDLDPTEPDLVPREALPPNVLRFRPR